MDATTAAAVVAAVDVAVVVDGVVVAFFLRGDFYPLSSHRQFVVSFWLSLVTQQ